MEATEIRRVVQITLTLALAFAAAVSCGGGESTPSDAEGGAGGSATTGDATTGGGGSSGPTQADSAFISDLCAAIAPCCPTNHRLDDTAVCQTSLRKIGMSRDAQLRSACLDELRGRSSSPACMPDLADFDDPCVRVFNEPSGPRAPGEACATTADCAGSPQTVTYCNFKICVSNTVGKLGDSPCLGEQQPDGLIRWGLPVPNGQTSPVSAGFICPRRAGLYCAFDNHCTQLLADGSACAGPVPCNSGACDYVNDSLSTCRALPSAGQACEGNCAGDNYCTPSQSCAPKLAAGTACTRDEQCTGTCEASDLCSGTCLEGACLPTNGAQSLLLGVWCGQIPVSG